MLFRGYKVGNHCMKSLGLHYSPLTSQQAIEKWEMAVPTRLWRVAVLGKLAISKFYAYGEFLRVCSADFAFLTQNSINSIHQCTIFIQQHIYTVSNIFHGNFNI